jgi:hypothetical protein
MHSRLRKNVFDTIFGEFDVFVHGGDDLRSTIILLYELSVVRYIRFRLVNLEHSCAHREEYFVTLLSSDL